MPTTNELRDSIQRITDALPALLEAADWLDQSDSIRAERADLELAREAQVLEQVRELRERETQHRVSLATFDQQEAGLTKQIATLEERLADLVRQRAVLEQQLDSIRASFAQERERQLQQEADDLARRRGEIERLSAKRDAIEKDLDALKQRHF